MRMLLFLPYDQSDQTFYSQTKVNSKISKVIASRCYAWSLDIKQSPHTQGSVNQKENSSISPPLNRETARVPFTRVLRVLSANQL